MIEMEKMIHGKLYYATANDDEHLVGVYDCELNAVNDQLIEWMFLKDLAKLNHKKTVPAKQTLVNQN